MEGELLMKGTHLDGAKTRGFALWELIISLAILSFLLGLASVSFLGSLPRHRLQRALWEIHSKMNYARYKAIFDGAKSRIVFNPDGYTIEMFDPQRGDWVIDKGNVLEGVFIEANNSPVFHPQGTVSNLASVTVSNNWGSYKITLAISGRIKIVEL
jgi:prepilin-type N-terminal cleavage/methylation domain-containing protein